MPTSNQFHNNAYTITADPIDNDMVPRRVLVKPLPKQTLKFRIKDDDGEVYFEGVMRQTDTEDLFYPLDRLGSGYGCTSIEILEKGRWEAV